MNFILGWSFNYKTPIEHWSGKRKICAANTKDACSVYINTNSVISTNPSAVLHIKEVGSTNEQS